MVGALLLVGCASTQTRDPEANDPLEPMNRAVFDFNMRLDRHIMRPVAVAYRDHVPDWTRAGVRSSLDYLNTPVIFANDMLQGNWPRARITLKRFFINTLLGPVGIRDVAQKYYGIEFHEEDFGQTLAVWGAGEGAFLMLPFFGPSNPRDLVGDGVDIVTDPTFYIKWHDLWAIPVTRAGLNVVDSRSRNIDALDELEVTSIDFYAAVRSFYRQNRDDAIRNGEVDFEDLPDF